MRVTSEHNTGQHRHGIEYSEKHFHFHSYLFLQIQTHFLNSCSFIFRLHFPHKVCYSHHSFRFCHPLLHRLTQARLSWWDCGHGRRWLAPQIRGRVARSSLPWTVSYSQAKGHRVTFLLLFALLLIKLPKSSQSFN